MTFIVFEDNEYATMKAAGAVNAIIYDLSNMQEQTQIEFWIEHYVNGKMQEKLMSFESEVGDPSAGHKLYFSTMDESNDEQLWTVAFREGNSVASAKGRVKSDAAQSRMMHPVNEILLSTEQETIASIMIGAGYDNQVIPEGEQQEEESSVITSFPEVFILMCKISYLS
ncbi:hypothetical protein DFQ01_13069 [Paenibacillus cellulosilyticus]|uniref:Uncharacterized protein n=2 Tax=Paenibacillus cellulosilyticus TaxID=375489 RepID=A0A2V2YLX1_9BACL|nr:hypothetical protein DFQ01_13069 [Paenibacillus cellulosilyticus]